MGRSSPHHLFELSFSPMAGRRREARVAARSHALPLAPSTITRSLVLGPCLCRYCSPCVHLKWTLCPLAIQPRKPVLAARQRAELGTETRCPQSLIELQWMHRSRWGHFHPWNEESIELPHYRPCSVLPFSPSLLLLALPFFSTHFYHHLHRLDGANSRVAIPLCYARRSKNMV